MGARVRRTDRPKAPSPGAASGGSSSLAEKGKKIREDLSKILDDIDDVLEENAEEFIKNYIQRGGE